MTAIGEHLSPLLVSEIVRPDRLWDAVGHAIQRLDIWTPQMDMDLVILGGDDTGTCVGAVGPLMLPAVLPLRCLAEDGLIRSFGWIRRTGPDCDDLNGGAAMVRRRGA